ncbi:MAG: arylesterase, partial [Marinobacter sp.]|nr:arylesterase [Marinobacter sp.]
MIFGDSLSAAYGVQTEEAWVALLKERLDEEGLDQWQVVNASISGETTDGGLRRLPELLEKNDPDIVIIELGGNDGLRGFPPHVIRRNLSSMIEQVNEAGARALLVGMQIPPNYGQRYTSAFAKIYPELANEQDTELVPFFLDGIY